MTSRNPTAEDLLRQLAPQVLGTLLRRHRALDLAEDAVQEALVVAANAWPVEGIPDNPRAWLVTVANRRLIDAVRSDRSRRRRELANVDDVPGETASDDQDDTLVLLLLCCHPALTPPSQIALTLRAVGGLSTAEIAAAFFVPEATMAQRVSRAKQRIRDAGATFSLPPETEIDKRVAAVCHVLYLIFTEGSTASSGPHVHRLDLTHEAVRLTRMLRERRPDDTEIQGLLALMLLTDARRPARLDAQGELVSLADQDRSLWDGAAVEEGVGLVTDALAHGPVGAYQLQAAIAAVHDEACTADQTDWAQIAQLYEILDRVSPNPMATVNRALAVAMVDGPEAGLRLLDSLADDQRIARHHRLLAMRGHLLELAGRNAEARLAFDEASRRTASIPEKRYLRRRARGEI